MSKKFLHYVVQKINAALPLEDRFNPGLCPICGGQLHIAVVQKMPSGTLLHAVVCDRDCFPAGICTSKMRQTNTAKMLIRWEEEYVPMLRMFSTASKLSFPCPSCGGTVRLTPDIPHENRPILRAYCVDNDCELPLQWAIPRKDCRDDLVISAVRSWKRQFQPYWDWFHTPLSEAKFKKPEAQSCRSCNTTVFPLLQRSTSFIGRAEWVCPKCGNFLARAELDQKKIRRGTVTLKVANFQEDACAICGRSQGMIEACGSHLEKHHKTPLVDAGKDAPANVMLLCTECHVAWHSAHNVLAAQQEKDAKTVYGITGKESRARFTLVPVVRSLVLRLLVRLRNFLDRCIASSAVLPPSENGP